MLKTVLISVAQLCFVLCMASESPSFHSVKPKSGDGIYSLLRRYHIEHECDKKQFLEINDLTMKSSIHTYKQYKLPVYIYTYNGKSIRSTIGSKDWDKAVRIKNYNEKLLSSGVRSTAYAKSKILWVPYSELNCTVESISEKNMPLAKTATKKTTKGTVKHASIYGEKYADVNIIDNTLKGKVYYIVSGHGGPDPGAMCDDCAKTMCEDEYAYDIALRLSRNLMQHGATVHMVIQDKNDGIRDSKYLKCDRDERSESGKKLPRKQKARLVQRAAEINANYRKYKKQGITDQTAVFIHIDSRAKNKKQDVFFYHHKNSKSGKKLAHKVRDTFDKKYKKYQKNRGYKGYVDTRGLYVLNYTQPTSLFVELANIKNKNDHERLIKPSNRQALANWLFDGMTK